MDKENLVEKCRRVSVVLTPLKNSEINKWRNQRKSTEKLRRNRWKKGIFKQRPKKPQGRKCSVSSSNVDENCSEISKSGKRTTDNTTCGITDNEPVLVEHQKRMRTADTRDSDPSIESNESFPLWKYKRKRITSVCSSLSDDEPSAKRVEMNSSDMNLSGKELHINLERLTAVDESCADIQLNDVADGSEVERDINEDTASLIMDSCGSSHDTIGVDEGSNKEMTPISQESQESDETDDFSQLKDTESFVSSDSHYNNINGAPSDEENESEADNDEELTDLCLMKEPTVLVTKLEDMINCLEDNRTFPDFKHLSREHINIILNFRHFADTSDDTSYCLVMSPDTESMSSDTDETLAINNSHAHRIRNRRRISSDGSCCSDIEPSPAVPEDSQVPGDSETAVEEPAVPPSEDDQALSEVPSPTKSLNSSSCSTINAANEPDNSSHSEEAAVSTSPLSCPKCQESFKTTDDKSNHQCAPKSKQVKLSKSGNKGLKQKKHAKMTPKSTSTNCTVCSEKFDNYEQLSDHIFKHTPKELQEAYIAAARDLGDSQPQLGIDSDPDDCVEIPRAEKSNLGVAIMNEKSPKGKVKKKNALPVAICPCHTDSLEPTDLTVQIEMVLYCEVCKVLFRRSECLEMHYRSNAECNKNRGKGRSPHLFCSTCRVVLNTLSDMRKHLEKHVSINRHGTVTFVCNICRVVFFGVGTVFCTHWFNHEKDPMFVASRYSFPKLCVSHRGKSPLGKQPGEQYFFVAEYVCRFCKQQFSSDSDLSNHIKQECKGVEFKQPDESEDASQASVRHKRAVKKVSVNSLPASQTTGEEIAQRTGPRPVGRPRKSWTISLITPSVESPSKPPPQSLIKTPTQSLTEPSPKTTTKPLITPATKPPPPPQPPLKIPILSQTSEADTSSLYVKTWVCDICEKAFPTRKILVEKHAVNHFDAAVALERFNSTVERPYACTICRKAYGSLDALSSHWQKHDLMKYLCSACNETYYSLQAFSKHVIVLCRKHNPVCRVSFGTKGTCKLCKIAFKELDDLIKHNIDYHGAGRIVGTRLEMNSSKNSKKKAVSKAPATVGSQNSIPTTPTKNPTVVPVIVARQYSPIAPKTPVTPPAAQILSPRNSQDSPIVLCVQSPSANELMSTNQQINGPLVINIAIPNIVQSPTNLPDPTSKDLSPPKVRALEDPTVQVVLTQSNSSDSTISASLVTDVSPIKTMTSSRGQNSSTYALTVRDTTASGGSITQTDLAQEETIANSLLQNTPSIEETATAEQDATPDNQNNSPPEDRVNNENNNLGVDYLPDNATTSNSDDIQILDFTEKTREKSVEKTSPRKSSRVVAAAAAAVDSDIEILSETSAQEEREKTSPEDETLVEKNVEEESEKTDAVDESSEGSSEVTLVKNPLSKPQGFLRVKNLSELQDENKNVNNTQVNNKTGNTLTEHLMAHLKPSKSPTKQQCPSTLSNGINSGESTASGSALAPGKRILPKIPQRVQGNDARRASPLISRQDQNSGLKPMNRVTPISTTNAGISVNAHCSRTMNPQYLLPTNIEERLINPMSNVQTINAQNAYVCPICPSSYHTTANDFLSHLAQHPNLPSNVQAVVYGLMNEKFPSSNQVQQPRQLQNQQKYKCLLCPNYETDSSTDFHKHFLTHAQHRITTSIQSPLMCYTPQIGGTLVPTSMNPMYSRQYQYQEQSHLSQGRNSSNSGISVRPQLYRCSLCSNYQFRTYAELERHVKTMHGNILNVSDRFVCSLCPNLKVFVDERTLKEHERTQHTFVCSICLQKFSNAYELDTHCDLHKNGQLGNPYSNNR